ncbi:TetR family transcriptional regulator [Kineococcus aurantiacus]|uniref:AcrR family transcriptional regulator n=1 Tax=Kineococcus aurantiacus TaxID=37633 RepID=A0A7Y9DKI1_9ACTN|nr:AcrR family transcriptional regulator [Kineococcus aurantiacus]
MTTTTRRRAETRAKLLAAALDVLGEQGLARSSVESVCERAGFTRGAFYSNFATMDDVVAALHADQAAALVERVTERLAGGLPGTDLEQVVAHVVEVLPVDRQWHAVRTEFTAQALRNPDAARALAARRAALRERLAPVLLDALARVGRRPTVAADELVRALVTAHEGLVTAHLLGEPPGVGTRLLTTALETFTEEVTP